ncbi:hypothetical protein F5Y00DRAFT_272858 [Daldinia vernicosa]|uniref:uncharacterized protein n=1 Tax=Daldinia vernicosa TaxID=114800 RepID=UPI002008778B|nr:uncharacterized protein F5Y00DRAFT_272858 [Daldinia vernicosa]KAI0845557.1 hypothetical protein F5Y00DRAFT_272858 [Daldinia vernicosa]
MTDFSWLRLGQRSRTPSIPRTPTSPERTPRRAASNLSLTSHSSHEPLTGSSVASLFIREQDKIWYNPSLDQMVEALQVVLMTQGALQPIPIEYNSYILHLIEGFANAQEKIQTIDAAYNEARHSLEYHLEHFKSVADEWLERESQYKAEIKRLEVLLSRTSSDGLEAVTLARTNSVVDRNGPQAKQFVSKLKRLSTQTMQEASLDVPRDIDKYETKPVPKVLDSNSDFLMSERIRRHDTVINASMIRSKSRRRRYETAVTSGASEDSSKPEKELVEPTVSTGQITPKPKPKPLFSDDVSDASEIDGRIGTGIEPSGWRRKQARRQILENLLDCEDCEEPLGGSSDDASFRSEDVHRHPSGCGLDDVPKDVGLNLDERRLRCLSGFSFVPGDDVSHVLTSGGSGNKLLAGASPRRNVDKDAELWKPRFKDMKENSAKEISEGPVCDLSSSPESLEDRWSSAAEKSCSRSSCTSSLDTVIQAATGSPSVAAYFDSPRVPIALPTSLDRNRVRSPSSGFELTSRRATLSPTPGGESSEYSKATSTNKTRNQCHNNVRGVK